MKRNGLAALTALVLALSAGAHAAGGSELHSHRAHTSGEKERLQLNAGKKWKTDAPLRQSMETIAKSMAKALPMIHANQFGDRDYEALAVATTQQVAFAVEHCKLEPKADAMLHLIIADLMASAEMMEGKSSMSRHDGAIRILESLRSYGIYFDHPGWKPLKG